MADMDLAEGVMSMEHGTTDTAVDRTPKLRRVSSKTLPGTDRRVLLAGASNVARHKSRRSGEQGTGGPSLLLRRWPYTWTRN